MAASSCVRSPYGLLRRIKIAAPSAPSSHRWASTSISQEIWTTDEGIDIRELAKKRGIKLPEKKSALSEEERLALSAIRAPRNLQALRLRPLRRVAEYGIPVCDLQLRTYSLENMELFADFALRAAYYLGLPAKGPIPLPKITERWTVPRANFVFKKSQENFERITRRRLIQIQDGHPETVRVWLGILQKYQYHGVGMKANVWEWDSLAAPAEREAEISKSKSELDKVWKGFGTRKESVLGQKILNILSRPEYGGALEVAKQEDERETARMNAADKVKRREEKEIEEEEFDKTFVMAFGPEALDRARGFSGEAGADKSAEEKKMEIARMNRVMAELNSLSQDELEVLKMKWRFIELEAMEAMEDEDGVTARELHDMSDSMDFDAEEASETSADEATQIEDEKETTDTINEPPKPDQKS